MKSKCLLILFILSISCKPENKELIDFDLRNLVENNITLSEMADEIYQPANFDNSC